jgi:hypothetical protein
MLLIKIREARINQSTKPSFVKYFKPLSFQIAASARDLSRAAVRAGAAHACIDFGFFFFWTRDRYLASRQSTPFSFFLSFLFFFYKAARL